MRKFLAGLLLIATSVAIAGNNSGWTNSGGSLATQAKSIAANPVAGGSGTTVASFLLTASALPSNTEASGAVWSHAAYNGATETLQTDTVNGTSGKVMKIAQPISYPDTTNGQTYGYLNIDVAALNSADIYIDFWAKMSPRGGLKFLKLFGNGANDFPHTTFQPQWNDTASSATPTTNSGRISNVSFGDGSSAQLDNNNILNFDCLNKTTSSTSAGYSNVVGAGRSGAAATINTPQNATWNGWDDGNYHHFRIRVKYNTGTTAGNEVANGAYYVEIDGLVFLDSSGLFNRHYSDGQNHKWITFFGYSQNNNYTQDIRIGQIKIATGGWPL